MRVHDGPLFSEGTLDRINASAREPPFLDSSLRLWDEFSSRMRKMPWSLHLEDPALLAF